MKSCMVCENPDWSFIECYREVSGLEYKLLQRLCEKHKTKILAMEILDDMVKKQEPKKPTLEEMKRNLY